MFLRNIQAESLILSPPDLKEALDQSQTSSILALPTPPGGDGSADLILSFLKCSQSNWRNDDRVQSHC